MSDDLIARFEARSRWTNLNVSDGDLFRQAAAELRTLRAEHDAAVQAEVAAMNDLQAHKDALAQVGEFICRKCGRRQEATFAPGDF